MNYSYMYLEVSHQMERLQKVIAQAGIASRRKAEQLILEGKVRVNGEVVTTLGTKVSRSDVVEVNGIKVEREEKVYYLFYKPRGVVSTVSDDRGRKTVLDFFHDHVEERIFPVGRLDFDTSGLILLTNDGEFANLMTHPKYKIEKTYIARLKGIPSFEDIKKLRRGIMLEDGMTAPADIEIIRDKKDRNMILDVTIHEGRNRQIRRMFEYFDLEVLKLTRTKYDFLNLDNLSEGEYRFLKPHEVKKLIANAKG